MKHPSAGAALGGGEGSVSYQLVAVLQGLDTAFEGSPSHAGRPPLVCGVLVGVDASSEAVRMISPQEELFVGERDPAVEQPPTEDPLIRVDVEGEHADLVDHLATHEPEDEELTLEDKFTSKNLKERARKKKL